MKGEERITSTTWCRLAAGGDHPDGGGVLDADALAEGVVGFYLGGEPALGIDGEGHGDAFALGELVGEVVEDFEGSDGGLVGKDGIAVLVAEGLGLEVEPAGVDGGVEAPGVEGQREVVADPGDLVFGGSFFEERVGASAVRALEVFKLDDGDARGSRRTQGRGILHLGILRRSELRVGCSRVQ
jgi:hypothetical protein